MSDDLMLRISDLRSSVDGALSATAAHLGDEVALSSDYYWHLPVDAAFDMTREPAELAVGSLAHDLEDLRTEVEPAAAWHDIARLVGLIRALEKLARP